MDTPTPKPLTKTALRIRSAERRRKIYSEAELCGPLRGTALAMIDYVYSFTPASVDIDAPYFDLKTEWVFEPDPWIALKFTHDRKHAVHVSVGVRTLRSRNDLPLKNGRYANWTRFTVSSPQHLPSAMLYLEEAYYEADNAYRKWHGKPKKA